MLEETAIQLVRSLLADVPPSDLQASIFRYSWQGLAYSEIAKQLDYDEGYIRDVGYQLWQALAEQCG
ncbi:MAG: hypothetical protein AAF766_21850, partial [Cyanobacteria bacterium P01_D01_bin.14]